MPGKELTFLKPATVLAFIVVFTSFSHTTHAQEILLRMDGLEGEVTRTGFVKHIEVLAWSWNMSTTNTTHVEGAPNPKPVINDIRIVKETDKTSPHLATALLTGRVFKEVVLTARTSSEFV